MFKRQPRIKITCSKCDFSDEYGYLFLLSNVINLIWGQIKFDKKKLCNKKSDNSIHLKKFMSVCARCAEKKSTINNQKTIC